MPLEFHGDAIVLSGKTGTKIKTGVLGQYYDYWQGIVSGGPGNRYRFPSIIMEMNAGTGEIYLEDERNVILGSAGHALELKYGRGNENRCKNLRILLVEEHSECLIRLIRVINNRWPDIALRRSGDTYSSPDNKLRIFSSTDFRLINQIWSFGNYLIFFDPLRATKWNFMERVASERIREPYQRRTEFLVFLFTSDWIIGRKGFSPLPRTQNTSEWSEAEHQSAAKADEAFGDRDWFSTISQFDSEKEMERVLIQYYQKKLRRWFRFVTPLPFKPKANERYDLFCCSNDVTGGRLVRNFFRSKIQQYTVDHPSLFQLPEAKEIFPLFKRHFPQLFSSQKTQRTRPPEWKIFWQIVRNHPDGICDMECENLRKHHPKETIDAVARTLEWLNKKKLLKEIKVEAWPWTESFQFPEYIPNWARLRRMFGLKEPPSFEPLEPL